MDAEQYSAYRHEAVHELMRLNQLCEHEFTLAKWQRWDYDLDRETLTFSQDGTPKVVASIQIVGSTSMVSGTWLWSWANESDSESIKKAATRVKAFGEAENIPELTQGKLLDDEYLGWALTAVTAKIVGAKGAYRCPRENGGFLYFIFTSIGFVSVESDATPESGRVKCDKHGSGFSTFVCEHLVSNPAQRWFSQEVDEEHKWPDAWCAACDVFFQEHGEWNEKNESKLKIKILCHRCYEKARLLEKAG